MSASTGQESAAPSADFAGGTIVDVAELELLHEPVAREQDGGGHPTIGAVGLGSLGGTDFGVWEMSTGTMFDVEAEEIFVVIAGRGHVVIEPSCSLAGQRVELGPGTLMRLSEGMKTVWTITETLRKVYVTPSCPSGHTPSEGTQP